MELCGDSSGCFWTDPERGAVSPGRGEKTLRTPMGSTAFVKMNEQQNPCMSTRWQSMKAATETKDWVGGGWGGVGALIDVESDDGF